MAGASEFARYALGNIAKRSLLEIWTSEDYCRFRNEVRDYIFLRVQIATCAQHVIAGEERGVLGLEPFVR